MPRLNLDLGELRAYVLLAELKSFRAAADAVGLSGPALSRLIARIEGRVGARLFDRDTRNVALTPAGSALRTAAERILAEADAVFTEFDGYLAARRGRVTLAGLPSVTAGLLPPLIARFVAERPDVDVRILDGLSDDVIGAVLDGRADLGFSASFGTSSRLEFRPLIEDPFRAIAGLDGPLGEDRCYGWAELVSFPFVAMSVGTSVRTLTEAAAAQVGRTVRPRFEVSHLATAGALVAQGLGVTALPALCLPVLDCSSLVVRALGPPTIIRRIGVLFARGRTLAPPAQAFREFVLAAPVPPVSGGPVLGGALGAPPSRAPR